MRQPTKTTPKILYIEGHSIMRDVYYQLLKIASDYDISVAENGLDGLEKALALNPDLILMGLRMPRMNGYEVIKELRSNPTTVNTPIIVVSAWANATSKKRALAAGADEHITPPVDIFWLLQRIKVYLNRQRLK